MVGGRSIENAALYNRVAALLLLLLGTQANGQHATIFKDFIRDEVDGKPVGFVESMAVEQQSGYLGCLYEDDLCSEKESCFDDGMFGRCFSVESDEEPERIDSLSPEAISLVNDEITRLTKLNLDWSNDYTQCVLQTLLNTLQHGSEYEISLCDFMQEAEDEDLDDDLKLLNDDYDNEFENDLLDKRNEKFSVRQEDDGGILIEPPSQSDDVGRHRRGLEEEEVQLPIYNDDYEQPEFLVRHKFDYDPTDYDDEAFLEDPEDYDVAGMPPSVRDDSSAERMVFNRNERLDVKKPGPVWPNVEDSYFLNKFMNDLADDKSTDGNPEPMYFMGDPFGPRRPDAKGAKSDNKGQIEYEMPLLAPVKDKRILPVLTGMEEDTNANNYVHLLLGNRFDTWTQGHDLIDAIANEVGVPQSALTDRIIEDHHVQFRVDPNPQNIDALRVLEYYNGDKHLQKRLDDVAGVSIKEASAGDREAYYRNALYSGNSYQLATIFCITVGCAIVIAVVVSIIVFMKSKVCRRSSEEGKLTCDPLDAERGKVQEEYKQLCRDWSRSSKSVDKNKCGSPGKEPSIQRLQSQDSKNSEKSSTSSWAGEEPTSTSMDISTGHMVLAYMEDHLKNKQRLEQEWVGLCSYEADLSSTTVAYKAENKKKNRYPDKLPFDHSRVILNAVLNASNSDYINASTVGDSDPRNPSYIVSQGPLSQTVADFWQMIWEQGCVVIVMLTRLQDNGYQLCHRYWPEEGSEQYHIFEVHLVSEHVWCEDYLVRSVYLKNTRTGETRTVTQFHFRSWPAQGVPASTKALLEFRRKVNKSYRGRSCPICVHCSDGVGRTGTYVLIDMVLNRMAKGCKEIDIAATLEHIRDQRSGMVQTRPQFEFSLMAVAEEVHAILKALLP